MNNLSACGFLVATLWLWSWVMSPSSPLFGPGCPTASVACSSLPSCFTIFTFSFAVTLRTPTLQRSQVTLCLPHLCSSRLLVRSSSTPALKSLPLGHLDSAISTHLWLKHICANWLRNWCNWCFLKKYVSHFSLYINLYYILLLIVLAMSVRWPWERWKNFTFHKSPTRLFRLFSVVGYFIKKDPI